MTSPNADIVIKNKTTIFSEINEAFERTKHPAIEYLVARPQSNFNIWGYGINFNLYGHSSVIYTMPSGERKVFNVAKKPGQKSIVEKLTPSEYLFERGSDQGGIFNRSFIGIRIEDVPDEDIVKMDRKFQEIAEQSEHGSAKFEVILGPLYNTIRRFFPVMAERGNCARWTSFGLQEAGLIRRRSLFPKDTFIQLFENTNPKNFNVVSYKCILNAEKDYGAKAVNPIEPVSPLQFLRNMSYWNLDWYATMTVTVPDGSDTAVINLKDPSMVRKPSKIRNMIVNNPYIMIGCALTSLYFLRRYPGSMLFKFVSTQYTRMKK